MRAQPPVYRYVLLLVICGALSACGSVTVSDQDEFNDPWEPFNRRVFAFNQELDRAVIKPVARAYRAVLPQFVRDRVRSILDNLTEPLIFLNDVLQGRMDAAGATFGRFVINSTVGLGGMFDRATGDGFEKQTGDFGQTLYRWGVADGPYLVLPLFGPSSVRDAFGFAVDTVTSPVAYAFGSDDRAIYRATTTAADGVDRRERTLEALDVLEQSALDFYIHMRSVWRQHRAATLRQARQDGAPEELIDPGAPGR